MAKRRTKCRKTIEIAGTEGRVARVDCARMKGHRGDCGGRLAESVRDGFWPFRYQEAALEIITTPGVERVVWRRR